jgi:serine/threonine protein kinase
MSITPGARIGPYEVVSPLGQGGMGVVYRARDTQLLRDVAVKLLPEHFANDSERLGRFQREAQVLASLNHPNIAQVYGFQQTSNSGAIVMELVDGETLADRLRRGPIPVDETISIAKQIVDALQAAHSRAIVHRDLKPANIKITSDGKVKVLDFGLAKAFAGEDSAADPSNSPTLMSQSLAGVIVGTAAYMSPEQARGSSVDARADIWAFGCVLYEMLTSKPVFTGNTVTDIIAKVIEGRPNWDLLPDDTPLLVRTLLASTLTKERSARLQHIDDARVFLNSMLVAEVARTPQGAEHSRRGNYLAVGITAAAILAALFFAVVYFRQAPGQASQIRFEFSTRTATGSQPDTPAISPDGQSIAYTVQNEGKTSIWIRQLGDLNAKPLAGTENGTSPFFSTDGRQIGFFADGKLKKISVAGGPPTALADTMLPIPGSWNRDGQILFASVAGTNLPRIVRVSESGGAVTPVTKPDTSANVGDVFPQFLPDGRHFLYVSTTNDGAQMELYAGSLDDDTRVHISSHGRLARNFAGRYAPPGYLLWSREGNLIAQRFNAKRLTLEGDPITIVDNAGPFWVSEQGTLVYRNLTALAALGGSTQLVWADRNGKLDAPFGEAADHNSIRLSRDGRRVAFDSVSGNNRDIWVTDLVRGVTTRLTSDPAEDFNPEWSPNGEQIVFASRRNNGVLHTFVRSSIAVGSEEALLTADPDIFDGPDDWSPDGKYVAYVRGPAKISGLIDIWIKPMFGDGKPFPYVQSKTLIQANSRLSPDGRWLAYTTNESGINQIVVQPFPDANGGKWQISANGGIWPAWRADGRELYYIALDAKLTAVPINNAGRGFNPGQPVALFQTPIILPSGLSPHHYDVNADGTRFLFLAPVNITASGSPVTADTITTIVNWPAALNARR